MARRPQYEIVAEMAFEDIAKTKGTESGIETLSRYVNILRRGLAIRKAQIEEAGEYSYALDKLEQANLKNVPASEIGKGRTLKERRNLLLQEIARYQTFFEEQSSTLEGIREINREQDIRIFGENESGQPKDELTIDERKEFWSLYSEYEKFDPTASSRLSSSTVQSIIADMYETGLSDDRANFLVNARRRLSLFAGTSGDSIEETANVYAGRRSNF